MVGGLRELSPDHHHHHHHYDHHHHDHAGVKGVEETAAAAAGAVSARPPKAAVLSMVMVGVLALLHFPFDMDKLATPEVFVERLFPELISVAFLAYTRLMFAIICFWVTVQSYFANGVDIETVYLPGSKLKRSKFRLTGNLLLCSFTSWSWNLLGLQFFCSAWITYRVGCGESVSPFMLRITLAMWETAAPLTLLVAAVVKYALWPMMIKSTKGNGGGVLKNTRSLLQHNANVFMALCEVALLGGLPVQIRHISLSVAFGVSYVFFSWAMMNHWNPKDGPACIYFFMDTTLGYTHVAALYILLGILMVFYGIFSGAEWLLEISGFQIRGHVMFVVLICSLVCRL